MIIDKNSPIPQYYQLQSWLVEQIEQGVFKPEDKIPTEEELGQMTGLARATIRQAIQNLVNEGYLLRRRRLGTFVKNPSLETNRLSIVSVMVHDIRSGYAPEFLRGAADEAGKKNFSTIFCNTDDLFVKADLHANQVIDHGVSGVIFMPTAAPGEKNLLIIEKFLRKNIPVVIADREVHNVDLDFVTTDNFDGAYNLTQHLIKRGHRKIAITLSTLYSSELERLEGYKKALSDYGIGIDSSLIFTHHQRFSEEHYVRFSKIILAERKKFTALFAGNDRIAYILYSAAKDMRIKIPKDLSLVGYDDLTYTISHPINLTTIHQPIYEMGQECMKLLLSRIRGESRQSQRVVLKSYLVERKSVMKLEN